MTTIGRLYYLNNRAFENITDPEEINRINNIRQLLKEVEIEIQSENGFIQIDTEYDKIIPNNVSPKLRHKIAELLSN